MSFDLERHREYEYEGHIKIELFVFYDSPKKEVDLYKERKKKKKQI